MRELTLLECEMVSGAAVNWNRVLDTGQEYGLQGAAVSGAVGGFLSGASVELWRQLRPSASTHLI